MRIYRTQFVVDAPDGKKYRGAQVWSLTANSIYAAVRLEANLNGFRWFPRSFAPAAIVNDPICLEVSGDGAASYLVTAAHPTTFGELGAEGETSVARGAFVPGRVPESLSGDRGFVPWWAGRANERTGGWAR